MAVVSRPLALAAAATVLVAAFLLASGDGPPPKAAAPKKHAAKPVEAGWDFPPVDPALHFLKPRAASRNPFVALVQPEKAPVPVPKERPDLVAIPANFAGGEGGWAYTGWAAVDGAPMALLENAASKQSGYVRVGDAWKRSRVLAITNASVELQDDKGRTQTVFRFNPNDPPKEKPAPEGGFAPPVRGRIGGALGLRPLSPPSPPTRVRP